MNGPSDQRILEDDCLSHNLCSCAIINSLLTNVVLCNPCRVQETLEPWNEAKDFVRMTLVRLIDNGQMSLNNEYNKIINIELNALIDTGALHGDYISNKIIKQ